MAYAALLSLSNTIDIILSYHRDSVSSPAIEQIISIAEYVFFLQAFLEGFPEEARRFEAIIKAVTNAAEDIIDIFISSHVYEPRYASLKSSVPQYQNHGCRSPGALNLEKLINRARFGEGLELCPALLFLERISNDESGFSTERPEQELNSRPRSLYKHTHYNIRELKEAKDEIESVAETMMKFKNSIPINDLTTAISSSRAPSSHKDVVVGLDGDLMRIKDILYCESSALEVIPIVGMGGIGKTMLAKCVYNDQLAMDHFDIRAWVTVSQDCSSVPEVVSSLLVSMQVFTADSDEMKRLLVFQRLKYRRFLIILDDIWSSDVWDDLRLLFPDDGNGSRIVLTTRLQDVASYANSGSLTHHMHLLDNDQSWNLLQQTLFKQDPCPVKLEKIGKVIATRCRGLPLAVMVISGILSTIDQTEAVWSMIAENVESTIFTDEEQINSILSLSYVHLPRHLRTCLLYIAGFPEDYNMRVSKLIKLWIAEGFLKRDGSKKRFEEIGEEYLEDLVKRSLVLVIKRSSKGRIKRVSMHDLIREMCIRKAQQENFFRRFLCESRKIPLHLCASPSYGENFRTTRYLDDVQLLSSLGYYRLLKILDLQYLRVSVRASNFPADIYELFHLRYLALNFNFNCQYCNVPAGLSNLQNLQTFIIDSTSDENDYAYNSHSIPFLLEIWSMPQLRHIHIGVGFFFCLPSCQSFALENLQTLSVAVNFVCNPDMLKAIPNLKKLEILFMDRDDEEDYQLNNLRYLEHLENLKIHIHDDFPSPEKVKPSFPPTLKYLTLSGLELPWEDLSIVGLLPNLQVLKLRNGAYIGDTWETSEGEFPQLKHLVIDCTDLENWITETSHFPQLQRLVLYRCPWLNEIPSDIGEIPTLELIEVDTWSVSLVESAKQILEEQQECGNDTLRVCIGKAMPIPGLSMIRNLELYRSLH